VIVSFLRGLSVRDVDAALEEAFDGPVVSKSTVSRICAQTRERYRPWCSADARAGLLALVVDYRSAPTPPPCR